jgi:hypothetical protein
MPTLLGVIAQDDHAGALQEAQVRWQNQQQSETKFSYILHLIASSKDKTQGIQSYDPCMTTPM